MSGDGLSKEGKVTFLPGGVVLGFDDGLVENPLWNRKLSNLLRAIESARPERPLDALTVVVPAGSLLAQPDVEADVSAKRIAERGQRLYDIILTVQKSAGWRLPIHVVVSGCDGETPGAGSIIPGFADWVKLARAAEDGDASGANKRPPILGWPVPFGIDTLYQPEWIGAAFISIRETLGQQQAALLMQGASPQIAASIFLLPERIAGLQAGLATLLERMLQSSAYHEAFMLRGIYLSDRGSNARKTAITTDPASAQDRPLALGDPASLASRMPWDGVVEAAGATQSPAMAQRIFGDRIFKETGLSQPAHGEMTRRHHLVRRAKWALVACVAATAMGLAGIESFSRDHVPQIAALLDGIGGQIRSADASSISSTESKRALTQAVGEAVAASPGSLRLASERALDEPSGTCGTSRTHENSALIGVRRAEKTVLQNAQKLLALMAQIDSNGVNTIWAPTSYLDPLNRRVRAAVDRGYNVTICHALLYKMATMDGIASLLDRSAGGNDRAYSPTSMLDDTTLIGVRADEAFPAIVEDARLFDRYFRELNAIRFVTAGKTGAIVASFRDIAAFVLGAELPAAFNADYEIYGPGIAHSAVPSFNDKGVSQKLKKVLGDRFDAAVTAHYACRQLSVAVFRTEKSFRAGDDLGIGPTGSDPGVVPVTRNRCASEIASPELSAESVLRQFLSDYATIAARGAIPGRYDWIYDYRPDSSAPTVALAPLTKVELIPAEFVRELKRSAENAARETASDLRAARAGDTPILANADGRPVPSPGLTIIYDHVSDLFGQPFMVTAKSAPTSRSAESEGMAFQSQAGPIEWDLRRLQNAQRATEAYITFTGPSSSGIPSAVQTLVRTAATDHFVSFVGAELATAARPAAVATRDDVEAAAFANALPFLANIRNSLRQAQSPEALDLARSLDTQMSQQAARLLMNAERRLQAQGLYGLNEGGLRSWSGAEPLNTRAFGLDSPDDLKAALLADRSAVRAYLDGGIGAIAASLRESGAFSASNRAAAPAARWESLRLAFEAYDANRPENALTRLETFITKDLDQIRVPGCRMRAMPMPRNANYFDEQLRNIRSRVLIQCRGGVEARYAELAAQFDRDLAHRFPFAGPGEQRLADPNLVRNFFLTYGDELPALREVLEGDGGRAPSDHRSAAARFVSQLIDVQKALAPMLGAGRGAGPLAYAVGVEFFSDNARASGQGQVIEAMVRSNQSRAVSGAANPTLTWVNGQPVVVSLRWAANAPSRPLAGAPGQEGSVMLSVQDTTAQFRVEGDWALLRLLRAAGQPGPIDAPEAILVGLTVPITPNTRQRAEGGDRADLPEARIFLRMALKTPGGPDPARPTDVIALPVFPQLAPRLPRGEMALRQ